MRTPESGKDTNVLSKTPDEIKKSLERCGRVRKCHEFCAYWDIGDCTSALYNDALAYIQQLEAQNAELTEKAARYGELRGRIRELRADAFLRQTEPISPTSEKMGKQKVAIRMADFLYARGAIRFRKWLCADEVVITGEIQIVKPEPPKE